MSFATIVGFVASMARFVGSIAISTKNFWVFADAASFVDEVDGIDPGTIRLKRQNPEILEQLIINYNEVAAVLENTRFAEYLGR